MYYVIDLLEVPEDLIKVIDDYLIPGFKNGLYLHITKDSLEFFRTYTILFKDCEVIDIKKLKELLLIKHLRS